jgi:muramidase (phage lysozyme)
MTDNERAFLSMIAFAEIGPDLLAISHRGYNVLVGSTAANPKLFHDYSDHPRVIVNVRPGLYSTAAGRYQILKRTFDAYKTRLELPDFSPASQDAIAMQLIRECGAIKDINAGRITEAIKKVKSRWASMPGAGYKDQNEQKMADLVNAYKEAGGK